MLTELYRYALDKGLAAQPGFKLKRVKAYVLLSAQGEFLGIHTREKDAPAVYAPDIGALKQGPRCNPLIERAKIPLGMVEDTKRNKNDSKKHDFFLSMLEDGGNYEPAFSVVARALRDGATVQAIGQALADHKLKGSDPIGFMVDGTPLEASSQCLSWWTKYRVSFPRQESDIFPRCLITGELRPALSTVPKVSGLAPVGGDPKGDAFICYDKDAFRSYGLKQSQNASVSDEAMTAVNAALTDLIAKAPVLGNAKLVHWYSRGVPDEEDLIPMLLEGDWNDNENPEPDNEEEKSALRAAKTFFSSIEDGRRPERLQARYYIMPLSGIAKPKENGGRVMVRLWEEGDYKDLYYHIGQWFKDLSLISWDGRGQAKPPKLKSLEVRLLNPVSEKKKNKSLVKVREMRDKDRGNEIWKRVDKEVPNLIHRILSAIINGTALPDEIPARVLSWIRSSILKSDEKSDEEKWEVPFAQETLAFQLLKAWLCRKQRMRGDKHPMEATYNEETIRDVSYYCGQLMAVYVAIQREAMPEVGVSVAERYYTAASATPAFAMGKLAQLSQYHLSKLEPDIATDFEDIISEIAAKIGSRKIPPVMNMEQQTEFALGYYQQRAALNALEKK